MSELFPAKIARIAALLAAVVGPFAGSAVVIGYRYLSFFAVGLYPFACLLMAALLAIYLYYSATRPFVVRLVIAVTIFVGSLALSVVSFFATARGERSFEVSRAERSLEAALARATQDCSERQVSFQRIGWQRVVIDCGPPVRVAFAVPGGFADNWRAIVYDPTGAIESIPEPNPTIQSTPHELRGLFWGDITRCSLIRSNYYYCSFT